jgi:hypothetical protein
MQVALQSLPLPHLLFGFSCDSPLQWIIIGVVLGILVIAIAVMSYIYQRRRHASALRSAKAAGKGGGAALVLAKGKGKGKGAKGDGFVAENPLMNPLSTVKTLKCAQLGMHQYP